MTLRVVYSKRGLERIHDRLSRLRYGDSISIEAKLFYGKGYSTVICIESDGINPEAEPGFADVLADVYEIAGNNHKTLMFD